MTMIILSFLKLNITRPLSQVSAVRKRRAKEKRKCHDTYSVSVSLQRHPALWMSVEVRVASYHLPIFNIFTYNNLEVKSYFVDGLKSTRLLQTEM